MSTPAIIALALVGLLLLAALIAFGVGHRRWSWVSVAASFLVVLSLGGYLYLAARLLQFEWRWVRAVRTAQVEIHEVRDGLRPSASGALQPIADVKSITELRRERDRWARAVERIDNWRGRHWDRVSFRPPTADGQPGTIELPPPAEPSVAEEDETPFEDEPPAEGAGEAEGEGGAEAEGEKPADRPPGLPVDAGLTLYVFDDTPASEGGLYLGAFLVQSVTADPATGALTLTVSQTAAPDEYDRAAWGRAYDAVTVYDQLPADRWLAFSKVPRAAGAGGVDDQIAPRPAKRPEEELAALVPEPFREDVARHALSATDADDVQTVDQAEWQALREAVESGQKLPGEAWADVVFKDQVDLDAYLGLERDGVAEDDDALAAEVELGKAFELAEEGKATIRKVFYRRRLIDAETMLHGSVVPGGEGADEQLLADGLASLMQMLQQDIAELETAGTRLAQSQENVTAERELVRKQVAELTADLRNWERDAAAATALADGFAAEAKRVAARLASTEESVVRLGSELNATVESAVRGIDRVAPPAGRDAAAPEATF